MYALFEGMKLKVSRSSWLTFHTHREMWFTIVAIYAWQAKKHIYKYLIELLG